MFAGSVSKAKFPPTLFDRLANHAPEESQEKHALRLLSAEELKGSVARDLESLLNSRCGYESTVFDGFPEVMQSMCSYGMKDFIGLSLANPADRMLICRSLERTIAIHESRLKQVQVALEIDKKSVNRLKFSINALLVVHPASDPVYFDALLQPATLQYSVSKSKRNALA